MSELFKEIGEPSKRMILHELRRGAQCVSDLVASTGMKQPNISNHLAKLRSKGIVRSTKVGRQVYYSLASGDIASSLTVFLAEAEPPQETITSLDETAKNYAREAVRGDETACAAIIDQLLRQGVPLIRIYQHILSTSMDLIGRWYIAEAIDEGQEHLASAITERMMSRVLQYAQPLKDDAKVAVLGCVPNNYHSIGLRMISDYLRLSGWRTIYLGANVPVRAFLSAVREHRPSMVLVSCAREEGHDDLIELIKQTREFGENKVTIGVGGRSVQDAPEVFLSAGADFFAVNLLQFAEDTLPKYSSGRRRGS